MQIGFFSFVYRDETAFSIYSTITNSSLTSPGLLLGFQHITELQTYQEFSMVDIVLILLERTMK